MHSIILAIAYRLNDKFMLSILFMNPKITTSMQQKHELHAVNVFEWRLLTS